MTGLNLEAVFGDALLAALAMPQLSDEYAYDSEGNLTHTVVNAVRTDSPIALAVSQWLRQNSGEVDARIAEAFHHIDIEALSVVVAARMTDEFVNDLLKGLETERARDSWKRQPGSLLPQIKNELGNAAVQVLAEDPNYRAAVLERFGNPNSLPAGQCLTIRLEGPPLDEDVTE